MKTISPALAAHLAGEVTTLATCWKLTRRDGSVYGFTDHDRDLIVGGDTYSAASGFTPSAISTSSRLNIDNLEVEGMLDAGIITERDLLSGRFDYAEIEIFEVNHTALGDGRLPLRFGWLGEVTCRDGRFIAEIRGLTQSLSQRIGELYGPTCRARFGDVRCKVPLSARTISGTLTQVVSNHEIIDASRTDPADRFTYGTIGFSGGDNIGVQSEIRRFGAGRFLLSQPLPRPPKAGDTYIATEGCDKRFKTCCERFGNALNFRGEPHLPGADRLLETAATRSQ